MDIHTLAADFETDVKTLRLFLKLPEWSVIDIERLHPSSVPQMKYCFDLWHKPNKIVPAKTDIPPIPKSEFECGQLSTGTLGTKIHTNRARRIAKEQENFLQQRLAQCGLSVPQQQHSTKWRTLGRYDTSRAGMEDDDD